ncbi:MAG TPA: YibE/F family protein [Acidimicrobiia bacterium]|jgi:uncharacterized membrane protein
MRLRWFLAAVLAVTTVAIGIGLVVLWPSRPVRAHGDLGEQVELVNGRVRAIEETDCQAAAGSASSTCTKVTVRLSSGPEAGKDTVVDQNQGLDAPVMGVGDQVVLGRTVDPTNGAAVYYFSDYQRRRPLVILGLIFAVLVVGLARWKGVAALVGVAVSGLVLVRFILPSMLDGHSPVAVAVVGSGVILFAVVYLAHGINLRTTIALVGTLLSLGLTALLAVTFVHLSRLSGYSSEEATYVRAIAGGVDLQGLVLASIVIGSLGVLNDVTVTQASACWELHRADPLAGPRRLYAATMRIGRDHIASTVYTLVLAYAGAALPLFLLFGLANRHVTDVLTGEVVAEEIVRTLVGSIGLVASVPITTALAAVLIGGRRLSETPPGDGAPDDRRLVLSPGEPTALAAMGCGHVRWPASDVPVGSHTPHPTAREDGELAS